MKSTLSTLRRFFHAETPLDHKEHVEAQIAKLQAEIDQLSGKEHKQARVLKGKSLSDLRSSPKYVDACRAVKGLPPVHGFFAGLAAAGEDNDANNTVDAFKDAKKLASEAERSLAQLDSIVLSDDEWVILSDSEESKKKTKKKAGGPSLEERVPAAISTPKTNTTSTATGGAATGAGTSGPPTLLQHQQQRDQRDQQQQQSPQKTPKSARLGGHLTQEEDSMRQCSQKLLAKLLSLYSSVNLPQPAAKEVERLTSEISEKKAELSSQGLNKAEQDRNGEIWTRMLRVVELRQREVADKKHGRKETAAMKSVQNEVQKLEASLQEHKTKLREELGMTAKELKKDRGIQELEERCQMLSKITV